MYTNIKNEKLKWPKVAQNVQNSFYVDQLFVILANVGVIYPTRPWLVAYFNPVILANIGVIYQTIP